MTPKGWRRSRPSFGTGLRRRRAGGGRLYSLKRGPFLRRFAPESVPSAAAIGVLLPQAASFAGWRAELPWIWRLAAFPLSD